MSLFLVSFKISITTKYLPQYIFNDKGEINNSAVEKPSEAHLTRRPRATAAVRARADVVRASTRWAGEDGLGRAVVFGPESASGTLGPNDLSQSGPSAHSKSEEGVEDPECLGRRCRREKTEEKWRPRAAWAPGAHEGVGGKTSDPSLCCPLVLFSSLPLDSLFSWVCFLPSLTVTLRCYSGVAVGGGVWLPPPLAVGRPVP